MACACKVNRQLDYLQKHYGKKGPESKKTHLAISFKDLLIRIPVYLVELILLPFFFLGLFLVGFTKKKKVIRIDKLFGLKAS